MFIITNLLKQLMEKSPGSKYPVMQAQSGGILFKDLQTTQLLSVPVQVRHLGLHS